MNDNNAEELGDILLANSPDGILFVNMDGVIEMANSMFQQMTGYSESDLLGHPVECVIPDRYTKHNRLREEYNNNLHLREMGEGRDIYVKCRDGNEFPAEIRLSPVKLQGEQKVSVFVRDISQRKKDENELRDSEAMFFMALNSTPEALAISRFSDGKFLYINPQFYHLYGLNEGDIKGKTAEELNLWVEKNDRVKFFDILTSGGEVRNFETLHTTKSGIQIPVSITATIFEFRSEKCVVGWILDHRSFIETEKQKKNLEAQLIQSEKMKAIGQLTGGIAHDFNNILQSILGYCQLARLEIDEERQGELDEYLGHIQQGGERAKEMIEQMMIFSRSSPKQSTPQSLPRLIENVLKLLRPSIPTTIDINLAIADQLPEIMIDPTLFEQVILNLCINARDAISSNGLIEMKVGQNQAVDKICDSCHEVFKGAYINILIRDNGKGITESIKKSIFDPFYSTKEVGKGSGMGLAMAHGIVHDFGGHICLESVPDKGTAFQLFFPITNLARSINGDVADIVEAGPLKERPKKTGKILIVDDDIQIANYLSKLLKLHGYDTLVSNSSEQALDTFKANAQIDLVLTDLTMPKLSGIELAIKILEVKANTPVIICSGNITKEDEDVAKHAGINSYLSKPIDSGVLLKKIDELLTGGG